MNYSREYFKLKTQVLPASNYNGVIWAISSKENCEYCYIETTSEFTYNKDTEILDTSAILDPNDITKIMRYDVERIIKKAGEKGLKYAMAMNEISLPIKETGNYQAWQRYHRAKGSIINEYFHINKATGKKVLISTPSNEKYPGQGGAFSLVNGVYSNKGLSYPDWLGWVGDDLEAIIDLGKTEKFDSVRMHTLNQNGSWIYLPQYVEVFTSADGKNFTSAGKSSVFVNDTLTMGWITVFTPKQSSRYIKIIAKNHGLIADDKPGGGNKAWLFADEIQVY